MATTTVKALSQELKRSAADLLQQLQAAGIVKETENDKITEKDKTVLLAYLQKEHGNTDAGGRKKITLIKRESSEIRQADSAGRTRTVQVEVRKKRVLVKRGDDASKPTVEELVATPAATAVGGKKSILSEEELEKRAAEATRQAELLALQENEMKAAEEAREQREKDTFAAEAKVVPGTHASAAKAKLDAAKKVAKDLHDAAEAKLTDLRTRRAAAET